jgi:hypothetical protein
MTNLFTRVGWEVRFSLYQDQMNQSPCNSHDATARLIRDASRELVDYTLFIDEPLLTSTFFAGRPLGSAGMVSGQFREDRHPLLLG